MLQFLRGHASSWVIKILLGLIVVSFGIWGIGGLLMGSGNQILVAKVGKTDITKQAFLREIQRRLQTANREMKGAHVTLEHAITLGLHTKILEDLIQKVLLEQELEDLNLAVSPALLEALTREDPSFKNEQGRFDGEQFKKFLKNQGLTESQYLAYRARGLMEAQFLTGITATSRPAGSLSLRMFRDLFQERTVTVYMVNQEALIKGNPALQKVSDSELKEHYQKNSDRYKTVEKRSFEVLVLDPKQWEKGYVPSEQEIQSTYDQQIDNYALPEKRDLQVYTNSDWKNVKILSKLMEGGKPLPPNTVTTFHRIDQGELSDTLGQKAFELKAGEVSEVFKGDNGEFQVVKVLKVIPAASQPLHKVRGQVIADLKRQKALDAMGTLSSQIDQDIAAGASFEEIAKTHSLKRIRVSEIAAGSRVEGVTEGMVKTAFDQSLNDVGPMIELEDGSGYFVLVTKVTPQHVRPFQEVKEAVRENLLKELIQTATEERLKGLLDQKDFTSARRQKLAADPSIRSISFPAMTFVGLKERPDVTQEIRMAVWPLKKDQGVYIVYKNHPAVAVLDHVKPAVAEQNLADYTNLKNEIMELLNRDILFQYFDALKDRHGVTIYEDVLSNLTGAA